MYSTSTVRRSLHAYCFYALGSLILAASIGARPATAQPAGVWDPPINWPIVAVHQLHQPDHTTLMWEYDGPSARLWDHATGSFTSVPNNVNNIFCSGHAGLANGLSLVAGGYFINNSFIFDNLSFDPGQWITLPNMAFERFYPTCTTLGDGRILTVSGIDTFGTPIVIPEVFNPSSGTWSQLANASLALNLFPYMYLLPNGKVFYAGPDTNTFALDVATQTWTFVATSQIAGESSAMYEPGRVLKSGGFGENRAEVINLNTTSPAWTLAGPMAYDRYHHNLTILADGTVLATGGGSVNGPVYAAELFNPITNAWTTLASMQVPREYHSTAQLLPDGRVVSAGGDGYPSAEIFNPPYLFAGPRPKIVSAPSTVTYGQSFEVKYSGVRVISKVALVRLGAVTHSFDQNQRYVPLKFLTTPVIFDLDLDNALILNQSIKVIAPSNRNSAPPGAYMLFLISRLGVPSVATYVIIA